MILPPCHGVRGLYGSHPQHRGTNLSFLSCLGAAPRMRELNLLWNDVHEAGMCVYFRDEGINPFLAGSSTGFMVGQLVLAGAGSSFEMLVSPAIDETSTPML